MTWYEDLINGVRSITDPIFGLHNGQPIRPMTPPSVNNNKPGGTFDGAGGTFSPDPAFNAQARAQKESPSGQDFEDNHRALDRANADALRQGIDPFTLAPIQQRNPLQDLLDQMNRPYSFDPNSVDTSWVDQVLAARNAGLQKARDLAQGTFNTSDSAVGQMTDQYRKSILDQAPQIQQQNKDIQGNVASVFQKTLDANAERAAKEKAANEEMFQRLGIQAAANQPDLVGEAIQQGNNAADQSKNARVAELGTYGQTALNQNTGAANAILGEGQMQRSLLNRRLQDIFGSLDQKGADYNAEAAQQKADWVHQMMGNAYNQYKDQRDFARDQYDKLLQLQQQKAIADERWGPNSPSMIRAIGNGRNDALNGEQGIAGLNGVVAPNTQSDYYDIVADAGRDPNFNPNNIAQIAYKAREMEKNGKLRGTSDDVIKYVQYMQNLAKMKSMAGLSDNGSGNPRVF